MSGPTKVARWRLCGLAPVSWRVGSLRSVYLNRRHTALLAEAILRFGPQRSRSSVPARTMVRPSRAAAVKDGRLLRPPEGLVLDGREHVGRLACVGIDCRRLVATLIVDRREISER